MKMVTLEHVPKLRCRPNTMLEHINLSFIAKNHSSVTILKHLMYRWQITITAEFQLPNMIQS